MLRELGPVVRMTRYGIHAVARYAGVHTVLNDLKAREGAEEAVWSAINSQ